MLSSLLVAPATILIVVGFIVYARDVFRGSTCPDMTTWTLWTVAPLIVFWAQVSRGLDSSAWLTLAVGLGPAAVCLIGLRKGNFRLTKLSIACGVLSIGAIVLWKTTGSASLAIVSGILSDALAAFPTLVKAYRYPRSETPIAFAFFVAGAGLTLLGIPRWTFDSSAFATYIVVLYVVLFVLSQTRIGDRRGRRPAASDQRFMPPSLGGPRPDPAWLPSTSRDLGRSESAPP